MPWRAGLRRVVTGRSHPFGNDRRAGLWYGTAFDPDDTPLTARSGNNREVDEMVRRLGWLLLSFCLMGSAALAQETAEAPDWKLGAEVDDSWFDQDGDWDAIDPLALPGRDAQAASLWFFHRAAGDAFGEGSVSATFEPAEMGPDDRLSVFICSQVPFDRASRVTGYEAALDRDGHLRILRLDGEASPVLLVATTESAGALERSRSYILTLTRAGAELTAQARVAGSEEITGRVTTNDTRYANGRAGVALPRGAGRVAGVVAIPAAVPEVVGPAMPGKPVFE